VPDSASTFDFTRLLDAECPLAGLFWDVCKTAVLALELTGRERLVDMAGHSIRVCDLACGAVSLAARAPHGHQWAFLDPRGRLMVPGHDGIPAIEGVQQIEWSPCGRYLAVLHHGRVDVWNSRRRKLVSAPAGWNNIQRIAWNPKPANSEGQLSLATPYGLMHWSAAGDFSTPFQQSASNTTALSWDPTGTCLARAHGRGELQVWNVRTGQRIDLTTCCEHPLHQLAWGPSGATLAAASLTWLLAWDVRGVLHGKTAPRFICALDSPISCIAFRPAGNVLAAGNIHGRLWLCRPAPGGETLRSADLGAPVTHLIWSANGKHLAVGVNSNRVYVARVCQ
jgi:WD40 repeat protein